MLRRAELQVCGLVGYALTAAAIFFFFSPAKAAGNNLGLGDYITQVQGGNSNYKSAKELEKAADLRSRQWRLLNLPNLFGNVANMKDERLTNAPNFMGTKTEAKSYSLGFQQNFGIGLDTKLYYNYTDTSISGTNPAFLPQPDYITASPVLEVTQSLWRNFLGSETSAYKDLYSGGAQAQKNANIFYQLSLRASAEGTYWRLATARKLVEASRDNLKRSQKIQSWNSRQSRMSLSDRSGFLQSNATVAQSKIQLQAAVDEEKMAASEFNKMRGVNSNQVTETLQILSPEQIAKLPVPERSGPRKDVLAAEQQAKVDQANAKLSEEAAKPDVEVYATLSLNGRDPDKDKAIDQSFQSDYPYNQVGVRFSMPLSFGIASDVRESFRVQARGSESSYKQIAFESERNWQNLVQLFEDAKVRLTLATEMEKAQRAKLDYERDRFGKGRTTTYQVILFEQDFASAQVSRINLEQDILNLHAQLKTYGSQL